MDGDIEERLRGMTQLSLDDLLELGCELAEAGRLPDAESCFRQAMDVGSADGAFNLGNCLAEQERWTEAVGAYEVLIGGGVADAWLNLGIVLHELGDLAGEIRAYQRAEAEGDSGGPLGLAFALRELGDREAALEAARRSAQAGTRPQPRSRPVGSGAPPRTPALSRPFELGRHSSRRLGRISEISCRQQDASRKHGRCSRLG